MSFLALLQHITETRWLTITEMDSLSVTEARNPESRCRRVTCPLKTLGEGPSPGFCQRPHCLICGPITPVSAFVVVLPSPLPVFAPLCLLQGHCHKTQQDLLILRPLIPGWCGSVGWSESHKLKDGRFNSRSGHITRWQVRFPVGFGPQSWCMQEATNPYFSLT